MNKNLLGIGTSVSRDRDYDPMDTLDFAKETGIPVVQVYLNDQLLTRPELIEDICEYAGEKDLRLTCHAPEPLNTNGLSPAIITAAKKLLAYQEEKKLIIHFDENERLDDCLHHIDHLYQHGIITCLENYYVRRDVKSFAHNNRIFKSIFAVARAKGLPMYPVIDFPRLFISGIVEHINALLTTKKILDVLSMLSYKTILHMIDFSDHSQKRNAWCTIGKGLMPYKAIFEFMSEIDLAIDHCVLEYEDKVLCERSLSPAQKLLKLLS